MNDRLPPQNLEMERAVLGCALLDGTSFDEMADLIRAEDFYREAHAVTWKTIAALRGRGEPADVLTVAEAMRRSGDYQRVGGDAFIDELAGSVPHAANALHFAAIVKEKARLRCLIEALAEGLRLAYDAPSYLTVDEIAGRVETSVLDASRDLGGSTVREAYEAASESIERVQAREEGNFTGVVTGLTELDELTDGMQPAQLIVLAARPGKGKTTLGIDVASFVTLELNKSVLFCSLEMGRRELTDRILASRASVAGKNIRDGNGLLPGDHVRMGQVYEKLRAARWAIDDAPSRTVAELAAIARRRRATHGLDLIVVDYLQLVTAEERKGANRQEQVAQVSRDLKKLSKTLEVPVLALSQLNREVEGRSDPRPRLSDLRESGAIEQDADVVLLIHRPDDRDGRVGYAELIVAKNRSGPEGVVQLAYQDQYPRFRDFVPATDWSG
ncbi:replicative DNA helicase [Tautonia sp. JC769]|uniref:replicative DNA helicase n=1 Tax=Tautonia sp. JC769 TaxID=3232135 RepID=UPI0034590BB1